MNVKTISPFSILSKSIILFILGLIMLFSSDFIGSITTDMILTFLLVIGTLSMLTYIFNKEKRHISTLVEGILCISLGLFIKYNPIFLTVSIIRVIGLYALLNFVGRITAAIILYKNNVKECVRGFIFSLISLGFGVVLLFYPLDYISIVDKICSIYVILISLTLFSDFLREILDINAFKSNLKRRFRITLPIVYAAFIPQHLLDKINNFIKVNPNNKVLVESSDYDNLIDNSFSTIDIFIHLAPDCANGFGHVDISFDGITYSYGTYDSSSNRLFTLVSDGVLLEANTKKYINFINSKCNRSLIGFTLALNEIQHNAIKDKISSIKNNCIHWECNSKKDPFKEYTDETNLMFLDTNCKFYKFKSGYFKTYFTLTANCVRLADTIVGSIGLDLIAINGIITPGTYYNYLDNLFKRKNTIVVKKQLYMKQSSI